MNTTQTDSQSGIAPLLERTREQLKTWRDARLDDLQERSSALTERRDDLLKQGEELLRQKGEAITSRKEEALTQGKERLLQLEAAALEGARDLLALAEEKVGPNAAFLSRGRAALDDALVSVKSAYEGGLPIDGFDTLSIRKISPQLDGLTAADLRTIRTYEAANKNRKTLLKELDARLAELA